MPSLLYLGIDTMVDDRFFLNVSVVILESENIDGLVGPSKLTTLLLDVYKR